MACEYCGTCRFFDGEKKCRLDDERVSDDTPACEDHEREKLGGDA